jgi:hypothetical protein
MRQEEKDADETEYFSRHLIPVAAAFKMHTPEHHSRTHHMHWLDVLHSLLVSNCKYLPVTSARLEIMKTTSFERCTHSQMLLMRAEAGHIS